MLRLIKSLTLAVALVLILSVTGVYSAWKYAVGGVNDIHYDLKLDVFPWIGAEVLPEEDEIGQNHRTLIEAIINGDGIGLNTSKSYLNGEIKDRRDGGLGWSGGRDTLGSMAVSQGSELNELFSLSSVNLDFLLRFVDDTHYEIYTTGVYLGEKGELNWLQTRRTKDGKPTVPIGEYIYPIYKTTVVKTNGVWEAVETQEGSAKSAWYEESRSNANLTQIPSFDPDTWKEGNLTA